MLTVSGKTIGRKKPLFDDFSVPPPEDSHDGGSTLRDLIESIVQHEVAAFQQRQTDHQLIRALTAREIDAGVEAGKIDSGGSEVEPQHVDEADAVATALQAFEDGMYLVVIDGQEQRALDRPVYLQPDSRLTFVRLTLLAGG
jgi:hypothetical protein